MIAANCNTVPRAISYNKHYKLLAQATNNAIMIMDPYFKDGMIPKILFSLKGHTGRINSVQWINTKSLVSVSQDKSIMVWSFNGEDPRNPENWDYKRQFKDAHKQTINYLDTYSIDDKEFYIVSMCSEGVLKLWQGTDIKQIEFRAQLLFGKNLQETMKMQKIGENSVLLLVGGYDVNIHTYLFPRISSQSSTDSKLFKYKFSLLGHFNSLRSFDFSPLLPNQVQYLSSGSQDANIRIWKIQPLKNISDQMGVYENLKQFESKTSFLLQDENEQQVYNIKLESVLTAHQDAVTSVQWGLRDDRESGSELILADLCLLSASFDFTVCVWKADRETHIWYQESTLGAMTGNKHSFFGALFLEDDKQILSYTYNGAMNQWLKNQETNQWNSQLTIKGHFGEVSDLDWDQYDSVLATTSSDQTTRIFSMYKENGWFEISRPQVHGYDMNTLSFLRVNANCPMPSKILSGGDEKVIRLFEAPYSYVKNFNSLNQESSKVNLRVSESISNEEYERLILSETKKQPLGLMNKPVILAKEKMRIDESEAGGMNAGEFDPTSFLSNMKDKLKDTLEEVKQPPVEDILMTRTLWPEQQKLYGHAFEIFCLATTLQGDCAASACKAKDKKYADIIIWDLRKIQSTVPTTKLAAHTLTVIQMEFSKCGMYLLSCSRDRSWALFKRESRDVFDFKLINKLKEAHSRIIWGISWSHDDQLFVSASREKQKSVKVWQGIRESGEKNLGDLVCEINDENPSATAIRFFPGFVKQDKYGMLIGLESGDLNLFLQESSSSWTKIYSFPQHFGHCDAVRRIKFNKRLSNSNEDEYIVGTCGNDFSVRLFKLKIN